MKNNNINYIMNKSKNNFDFFAKTFLKVRTKYQNIKNFNFNKEQIYINKVFNKQKQSNNKIKLLILKGRQVGITTVVAARNYYFNIFNKNVKSLTLAHRQSASNNIFDIIQRFYNNIPFFLNLK